MSLTVQIKFFCIVFLMIKACVKSIYFCAMQSIKSHKVANLTQLP